MTLKEILNNMTEEKKRLEVIDLDIKIRHLLRQGQNSFGEEQLKYQARATTYVRKYEELIGKGWRI